MYDHTLHTFGQGLYWPTTFDLKAVGIFKGCWHTEIMHVQVKAVEAYESLLMGNAFAVSVQKGVRCSMCDFAF